MADFVLVSKRTLTKDEYRIFNYHYLLSADWRLCSRKLGIDRGTFFHAVYRIQRKLGRVFAELEPYSLYPLDEYFATTVGHSEPSGGPPRPPVVLPVRAPLQRAA